MMTTTAVTCSNACEHQGQGGVHGAKVHMTQCGMQSVMLIHMIQWGIQSVYTLTEPDLIVLTSPDRSLIVTFYFVRLAGLPFNLVYNAVIGALQGLQMAWYIFFNNAFLAL
jgi:hypothetical protein